MTSSHRLAGTIALAAFFATAAPLPFAMQETAIGQETPEKKADPNEVVATVGDVKITLADLIRARLGLDASLQQLDAELLYEGLLQRAIQEQLLAQAAERGGLTEDPDVARAIADARRRILGDAYLRQAEKKLYDRHLKSGALARVYELRRILVLTEKEAKETLEALKKGADFIETAKKTSIAPEAAAGGKLAPLRRDQLSDDLSGAISAADKSRIAPPILTDEGWSILKVEQIRKAPPPSFAEWRASRTGAEQAALVESEAAELEKATKVERASKQPPAASIMQDLTTE